MGAHIDGPDDGAVPPLTVDGGALVGLRARARRRERAGEDRARARRSAGEWRHRDHRAASQPRPHRADAGRARRAARARRRHHDPRARRRSRARSRLRSPATRRRRRSGWSAPRSRPTPTSSSKASRATPRASRSSTCSGAWAPTVEVEITGEVLGEPVGNIRAATSALTGTTIGGAEIALVQDEIPTLAVAAAFADGVTEIHDAVGAAGQGERPHRDGRAARARDRRRRRVVGCRPRDHRRAPATGAVRESRRPPHRDGRGDRRQRDRRRVDRSPAGVPPASRTRSSPTTSPCSPGTPPDGGARGGHRRPVGIGEVDGGEGRGACPRPPHPGYWRHVPRRHARRARSRDPARRGRRAGRPGAAPPTSSSTTATVRLDGRDVHDTIRGPEVTAAVSAVSAHPRGARGAGRPAARVGGRARWRRRRRPRHRHRRVPGRAGEGVHHRERRRTGTSPRSRRSRRRARRATSTT